MDEVTGLLETELAVLFSSDAVVDCDVLPGASVDERPDEYVSIVAVESEYRVGRAYIVEVEFRSVVPLDDPNALARSKRRLRQITDYLAGPTISGGTILGIGKVNLNISFYVMRAISSVLGERSRAEVAKTRFGVTALS